MIKWRIVAKYPEIVFYTFMVIPIWAGIVNYRNSEEPLQNFVGWFILGIISGAIAVGISVKRYHARPKTKAAMIDLWMKFETGGMMAFVGTVIFGIIFAAAGYHKYKEEGYFAIDKYVDVYVFAALCAVVGLAIFFFGRYKRKKYSKG